MIEEYKIKEYCIKTHVNLTQKVIALLRNSCSQAFLCLPPTKISLNYFFNMNFKSNSWIISDKHIDTSLSIWLWAACRMCHAGVYWWQWRWVLVSAVALPESPTLHWDSLVCPCLSSMFRRKVVDPCITEVRKTKFFHCTAKISVSSGAISILPAVISQQVKVPRIIN